MIYETAYLICGRNTGDYAPVAGSKPETCVFCKRGIWIAPSGQKLRAKKELRLACTECWITEGIYTSELQPSNSEQLAEMSPEERVIYDMICEAKKREKPDAGR